MAEARPMQAGPGKKFAGVFLSRGRDIRMRENALRGNFQPLRNVADQSDGRVDLRLRVGRGAAVMAGIDQFDADGTRIDVGLAVPETLAPACQARRDRQKSACQIFPSSQTT